MNTIPKEIVEHIVERLNFMLNSEPEAMRLLIQHKVPVGKSFDDDPQIQVGPSTPGKNGPLKNYPYRKDVDERTLGLVGLVNGFLEGWTLFYEVADKDYSKILRFGVSPKSSEV